MSGADDKVLEAIRGGLNTHVRISAHTGLGWVISGQALTRLHRAGRVVKTGRTNSTQWWIAPPHALVGPTGVLGWKSCDGEGFDAMGSGAGL